MYMGRWTQYIMEEQGVINMVKELDKIQDKFDKIENYESQALAINSENLGVMKTMTPDKIAKIQERMVEIDRANNTTGRKNTQHTNQLMTLTMLTDSPYRRLRQCLAQIEDRRSAIESNLYEMKKGEIAFKELAEKDDELSILQCAWQKHQLKRSKIYIEGALKELAVFQEAYEEIRKNNNIPIFWDEEDAEMDEARHHIRQVFRQAFRDTQLTGHISQGNAEYLEQWGIHLQTAEAVIREYLRRTEKMISEDRMPTIDHLYEFLDKCADMFQDEYIKVMKRIGLDKIVRKDLLYKNNIYKDA